MDPARKIASSDELRAIAAAGAGFIIDPFSRRWHLASCPHTRNMTTGQPKWLAPSAAALDDYLQQRHARHPAAKPIQACPACSGRARPPTPASAQARAAGQGADLPAGPAVQLTTALREIISEHGPAALSSPAEIANLLKDLLSDAPGISRMMAAAAQEHVADQLPQPCRRRPGRRHSDPAGRPLTRQPHPVRPGHLHLAHHSDRRRARPDQRHRLHAHGPGRPAPAGTAGRARAEPPSPARRSR